MTEIRCKLQHLEPLTDAVQKVVLRPETPMPFMHGQYLRVVMGADDRRPFSIANTPDDDTLELHIGATPDNAYAWAVLEAIKSNQGCSIDGPHGNAHLRTDKTMPSILLAGGTGYSYVHSVLQGLLKHNGKEPVFLYWGVRHAADLYDLENLLALQTTHKHLRIIPVVEFADADWQGRTGRVHEAVEADFTSLEPYRVYVAGRFEMAGVAREAFREKGLLSDNLFGDAYAFI